MELLSEKYLKRLIGRTMIEDALKRLDKLTQEETRMATAQVLKIAHTVDERVAGVGDGVDQVKCLSSLNRIGTWNVAQPLSQGINYELIFADGSPHQIHPRTITLPVVLITREPQLGSFKAVYITNGNPLLRFSGSMENVSLCFALYLTPPNGILCIAGAGKTILWFVNPLLYLPKKADVVYHFPALQSSKISKSSAMPVKPRWRIFTLTFGTSANNTGAI